MTAVAEPQAPEQQPLADVVALPLPDPRLLPVAFGGAADLPEAADDWMKAVALASAEVERLQWELDAAEEDLCVALRGASDSGVSADVLAKAAGITADELDAYLQRPALPAPAGLPSLIAPL